MGRFISPDTIVPSPSNPQDFNRYTYANNNPVNNVDPSGHGWFKKFWQSIVGVASAVLSIAFPPLAPALWAVNTGISAYTAIQTGNVLGFVGGLAGGWALGGLGHDIGLGFASGMGDFGRTFLGGALGGAVEFGISGFGAGLGAGLASGQSLGDSLESGGRGALSGAIIGAGIQGSYTAGWQDTLHGYSVQELGLQQGGLALQAKNYKAFDQVNSWVKSRTQGKFGFYLHGTDEAGYRGINITHSLFQGSSVTLPLAYDPVAKDFAFRLNPQEYADFTGMKLPKGEYFALAVGRADYIGTSIGGRAPEYKMGKNLAVSYKNPNR